MLDWLIDFNGMSTHQGLFYGYRVRESYSLYIRIYIFVLLFLKSFFFAHGPINCE